MRGNHRRVRPRPRARLGVLAVLAVLGLLLSSAPPAVAQPAPPTGLRVLEVGVLSVNITFGPSPSANVTEHRIYVSVRNGTSLSALVNRTGFPLQYDFVKLTPPGNMSQLQPASVDRRFWFRNGTSPDWTLGYEDSFDISKHVPSDFTALSYRISGLAADVTVYIAVTSVDGSGSENATVSPVEAIPLAQPVPVRPRNEGVYASWLVIVAIVLAAVGLVARHESRKNRRAYLYILPPLLGLVALTFYPVAFGFFLSFTDRRGQADPTFNFVGLDNYVRVFGQPDLAMVTTTTLVWTVVNVLLHVSIGLVLAILLNRKILGRVVYRALLLLPWAVPSYITTLAWRGMFETHRGLFNEILGPTGWALLGCNGPCQWLTAAGSPLPLFAVIATNVWLGFPFMMMVFSGGLQGIPPELYEAADVDGLTPWQKFRHITLPLLKPTIVPASLLGFIWTFNMFNVIYLMTAGGPPVPGMRAGATDILITYVYNVGFQPPFEQGFAAAYSVVIFFMLLGFGLFYTSYTGAFAALAVGPAPASGRWTAKLLRGRAIGAVASWIRRSIVDPLRTAIGPDQPEKVRVPMSLIAAIAALGVLEIAYGTWTYRSMRFWLVVGAVQATWFLVVGVGLLLGAAGLAVRQRAGRRLVTWALLLEVVGIAFAAMGAPLTLRGLSLFPVLALLALLARPVAAYSSGPDPWTRFVDVILAKWPARSRDRGPRRSSRRWTNPLVHAILIPFTFLTILPILVVAGTAFGEFPAMSLQNTPLLRDVLLRGEPLPGWTLGNFQAVLSDDRFVLWLRNSLLVSAGTTAVGLLLSLTGAYGFSRFGFRGKRASMLSFIVVQMFPGAIILIPYYVLMYQLGLINTHVGLVIMYSVTALPFILWFLKGFFDTIPVDLEEAAMVDGTTRVGAMARIIIPLAKPAIAVAALFSFLAAWNEWLLAFTFMTSSNNYTLPVGVTSYINPPQVFWNEFAAISILVSLPVVVLFIVFQKYLVSGLTKGAVKG